MDKNKYINIQGLKSLNELRDKIDQIDRYIVQLLNERFLCSRMIIDIKKQSNTNITQPLREQQVYSNIRNNHDPSIAEYNYYKHIYNTIIKYSKELQKSIKYDT